MDINYIRELASILNDEKLTELEYKDGDSCIKLSKNNLLKQNNLEGLSLIEEENNKTNKIKNDRKLIDCDENFDDKTVSKDLKNLKTDEDKNTNLDCTIKSSMVGTFYSKPSKDQPPFVSIGDKIKKGSTVCIIEAMKLMNEIKSSNDYEIIDILVKDGEVVEYGQDLFVVREV